MTLPSSGAMHAWIINGELGRAGNAYFHMGDGATRALAGVPSGGYGMNSFFGKSVYRVATITCGTDTVGGYGYSSEGIQMGSMNQQPDPSRTITQAGYSVAGQIVIVFVGNHVAWANSVNVIIDGVARSKNGATYDSYDRTSIVLPGFYGWLNGEQHTLTFS
ncbi:hypothetical protein [Phyllobacterium myrsinacearum]|uniref:Uncharacterized protein n=1 Tax=Phyllobacterium myrsinacearum TaxID=28101 RepID=A0A839ENU2_9HYPH|nr:hypothetical protein [Phyllobacterium myrsinacearum]MBA8881751.1 hypothetical protein [Phyllobacterium myrsinacearum]